MKKSLKSTSFDWILIGFILHALGGIFFNSSKPICYTLCGLGLVIIFFNALFQMPHKMPFKGAVQSLFLFYLLWSIFIIVLPFFTRESFTLDGFSLISPYTWLSLTTPLIVFLGFEYLSLRSIFKFSYIYAIIGIVLLILNYHDIFAVNQNFDSDEYQEYIGIAGIPLQFLSASSFMVLCYAFVPSRFRIIAFLTMFLSLFTVLFTARRSSVFMYLIILLFTFIIYVIASKKGTGVLKFILGITVFIVGIAIFNVYAGSTFSFFLSRLHEDTRSGIVEYFYESFKGKTWDWIIGRGINGTYYCPLFVNFNRGEIETGYLHIILKGGLIYLAFYLFFLAHSAYLGFFRTKNRLTKAMALYLVAHIIYLVPFGLPMFNFEFIIIWISILYCQSKEWRTYTDLEINKKLNFKQGIQSLPVIKFNYQ